MIRQFTVILFHALVLIRHSFYHHEHELFEFNKIISISLPLNSWHVDHPHDRDNFIYWKRTPFDLPGLFFISQGSQPLYRFILTPLFGYTLDSTADYFPFLLIALYYAFVNTFEKKIFPVYENNIVCRHVVGILCILEHFGHLQVVCSSGNFDVTCRFKMLKRVRYLGQPNWLAAYLIMLIPFVVCALSSVGRAFGCCVESYCRAFFHIIVYQSRSGLGLATGAVVFVGVVVWMCGKIRVMGSR